MKKLILIFLLCSRLFSQSAYISWDPNTEPDLSGYKVYYGTSPGQYAHSIDVGNVTGYHVTSLEYTTYYMAVSAYDLSSNESLLSEEVSITLVDTTPPIVPSGILSLEFVKLDRDWYFTFTALNEMTVAIKSIDLHIDGNGQFDYFDLLYIRPDIGSNNDNMHSADITIADRLESMDSFPICNGDIDAYAEDGTNLWSDVQNFSLSADVSFNNNDIVSTVFTTQDNNVWRATIGEDSSVFVLNDTTILDLSKMVFSGDVQYLDDQLIFGGDGSVSAKLKTTSPRNFEINIITIQEDSAVFGVSCDEDTVGHYPAGGTCRFERLVNETILNIFSLDSIEVSQIKIIESLPSGDINNDGKIDGVDLILLSKKFGMSVTPGTPEDLNGDGMVNGIDLIILSRNFGKSL